MAMDREDEPPFESRARGNAQAPDAADSMDKELEAMAGIIKILRPFDDGTRARILQWAFSRLVVSPAIRQQLREAYEQQQVARRTDGKIVSDGE